MYTIHIFARRCCVIATIVILYCHTNVHAQTCKPIEGTEDGCSCRSSSTNFVVDLSEIEILKINNDSAKVVYYYKPCEPMKLGGKCDNVNVCQETADKKNNYDCGHPSGTFSGDPGTGNLTITYNGEERKTTVTFECGSTDELTYAGELSTERNYIRATPRGNQAGIARFTLTVGWKETVVGTDNHQSNVLNVKTKRVCVSVESGLSTGSILLIIFFVLLIVYVIGGVLILRFLRGARGVEQIPNYEFWKDLPLAIKLDAISRWRFIYGKRLQGGPHIRPDLAALRFISDMYTRSVVLMLGQCLIWRPSIKTTPCQLSKHKSSS